MNWRILYDKITSIDQLSVGDFISWKGRGNGRRYAIIRKLEGVNIIRGNFNEDKAKALNGIPSFMSNTTVSLTPIHNIKREQK